MSRATILTRFAPAAVTEPAGPANPQIARA